MKKTAIMYGRAGFIIAVLAVLSAYIIPAHALDLESPRFHIDSANVVDAAGDKSSAGYKLSDTLGQLAAGQFNSTGYVVKAGFQYINSIIPFYFSVSDINIDLGTLLPNTPSTAPTVLTVNFGNSGQYQVAAIEETPLKTFTGDTITDTVCDGGINTCTESVAKPWTSGSAYGFGYNMAGNDITGGFTDGTYFRPFPDRSAAENPAIVMTSTNVGVNRQATLTFKANISPVQVAGTYHTVVNFIATPSY